MPIINTPVSAREDYFDRNATTRVDGGNVESAAPHAQTERFSRTISADRKGFLESGHMVVHRETAATAPGRARARLVVDPVGFTEATFLVATLYDEENAVGDRIERNMGAAGFLGEGDVVRGLTSDTGTGGTVDYVLATKVTLFDA